MQVIHEKNFVFICVIGKFNSVNIGVIEVCSFICPTESFIRPNESFICSNDSFIRSNEEIFFFVWPLYAAVLKRESKWL